MTLNEFRDLLARWALWHWKQNRAKLGYAQSSYTEMVGKGGYGYDAPDVDLDVLAWDKCIRTDIPPNLREILAEAHLAPGPASAKGKGRNRYFETKRLAEETALHIFIIKRAGY